MLSFLFSAGGGVDFVNYDNDLPISALRTCYVVSIVDDSEVEDTETFNISVTSFESQYLDIEFLPSTTVMFIIDDGNS